METRRGGFPLERRRSGPLDGAMPSSRRMPVLLILALVLALAVFVPGFLYVTELALRELRLLWGAILVLALAFWLLTRARPKR